MKKAVIFLADGFEEIEAITPIDILRRAGVEVTVAGVTGKVVTGAHNMKVESEVCASTIKGADFDAIICPGGMPGATNLRDSEYVINAVKEGSAGGKIIASLCASPMVLEKAGVISGKNVTIYPGMESYIPSAKYNDKKVVIDGKIITGAGPAASADWSFAIVNMLLGSEVENKVKSETLFNKF